MVLFSKFKIKAKILGGFFIVLAMFSGVVFFSYIKNQQIAQLAILLNKKEYPTLKNASQLLEKFKLVGESFSTAAAFADKEALVKARKLHDEARDLYKEIKTSNQEDIEFLKGIESMHNDYFEKGYRVSESVISGSGINMEEMKRTGELSKILQEKLETYFKNKEDAFYKSTQAITDKIGAITMVMIIIAIVLIGVSLMIGIMLANTISRSIARLVNVAKEIARCDLSGEKIIVESADEVGELSGTFNLMREELNKIITAVANSSKKVASSAQDYYNVSKKMLNGVEKQSTQSTQVATAAEEMNATIAEVAKSLNSATTAAQNTARSAEEGGMVVTKAIQGMQKISDRVRESGDIIQQLGKSSSQIGEIVSVIEDIADQTNLLALNAAIEAARAGEQGRGFAVVADEVRKLAERTTEATKEISNMIKQIQQDTASAVASMDTGITQVEEGVGLANQAGESLNKILTMVQATLDQVQQISTASEEQSSATEEISQNIELVASISKDTAAGATQSFHISEQLQEMALELQDTVNRFKLAKA